jgi:hydroxymethylbilane synthase
LRREIRFGSRESELAVFQARLVMDSIARAHPELVLRLVTMKTRGDLQPDRALGESGFSGKDLFTGALEQALEQDQIDLCVHSLKDMAEEEHPNLPVRALGKRGDPRDRLVMPRGMRFSGWASLDASLPVGCGSLRRRIQLFDLAPFIRVAAIRGNVGTRLNKMDQGAYGALILAAAGLERLGIRDRDGYYFPVREMIPAAGQGIIAVQGRVGEDYSFLASVHDPVTAEESRAERMVIRAIGSGCGSPAAAFATITGNEIRILGMYAAGAEAPPVRDAVCGGREEGPRLAERLARRLLQRGNNP